ncbi:MAG: 50S ribosomal protein L19 [Benjaminiella poitrasii]|nr:MAG: 50S ribosomal protein L19 [Benjaminiella poitrasii]
MEQITKQQIETANTDGRRELFDRHNPQAIRPGSIVLVETFNGPGETTTSTFMGVCIAIRRKGIDTNFTLRNIVMRVGVEQRYSLYSPLLKSIKVLQKPSDIKFRRAKLYYLRDNPGKVFQPLQSLWKQEQLEKSTK